MSKTKRNKKIREEQSKSRKSNEILSFLKEKGSWVISVISFATAIVTAIVAYQANLISQSEIELLREQNVGSVIVSNITHHGGKPIFSEPLDFTYQDGSLLIAGGEQIQPILFCTHKVRLSNIGGSPTSLMNFSARGTYDGNALYLDGFGEAVATHPMQMQFEFIGINQIRSVMISEAMYEVSNLDTSWLNRYDTGINFPFQIDANSSVDFYVHTIFQTDHKLATTIMDGTLLPENQMPSSEHQLSDLFQPFEFVYTFDTLKGARVSTPPVKCVDAIVWPPGVTVRMNPDGSLFYENSEN